MRNVGIKVMDMDLFVCEDIQFDQHHLLKMLSFFQYEFLFFYLKIVHCWVDSCLGLWFNSVGPLVCFYSSTMHVVFITIVLQDSLKSAVAMPPEVLFLYRIVLDILDLLFSNIKFSIICPSPCICPLPMWPPLKTKQNLNFKRKSKNQTKQKTNKQKKSLVGAVVWPIESPSVFFSPFIFSCKCPCNQSLVWLEARSGFWYTIDAKPSLGLLLDVLLLSCAMEIL